MTIYEIKEATREISPYFFSRDTLKFFGQTLKMFTVKKQSDGRYKISAPCYDRSGQRVMHTTERYYNPKNNELERS